MAFIDDLSGLAGDADAGAASWSAEPDLPAGACRCGLPACRSGWPEGILVEPEARGLAIMDGRPDAEAGS